MVLSPRRLSDDLLATSSAPECPTSVAAPQSYRLRLQPHACAILLTTLALTSSLVAVTYVMFLGINVGFAHDNDNDRTSSLRLDSLNTYSGGIAALLGEACKFVSCMVVSSILLMVAPLTALKGSKSSARWGLLLATSAIGWLLSQGFMALNVRLKTLDMDAVMTSADLVGFDRNRLLFLERYLPVPQDNANTARSSDTLLRTAILGQLPLARTLCDIDNGEMLEAGAVFGFQTGVSWLAKVLPKGATTNASASKTETNSTSTTPNLPMSLKNATALALYAAKLTDTFLQTEGGRTGRFVHDQEETYQAFFTNATNGSSGNRKHGQRDALLPAFSSLLQTVLHANRSSAFEWLSVADTLVNFTSTRISDDITFDAVTLHIPLRRSYYARQLVPKNDSSELLASYYDAARPIDASDRSADDIITELSVWDECTPNACLLPLSDSQRYYESQVRAFQICTDTAGNEDPLRTMSASCSTRKLETNSSLLVFSFAQRTDGEEMRIGFDFAALSASRRLEDTTAVNRSVVENHNVTVSEPVMSGPASAAAANTTRANDGAMNNITTPPSAAPTSMPPKAVTTPLNGTRDGTLGLEKLIKRSEMPLSLQAAEEPNTSRAPGVSPAVASGATTSPAVSRPAQGPVVRDSSTVLSSTVGASTTTSSNRSMSTKARSSSTASSAAGIDSSMSMPAHVTTDFHTDMASLTQQQINRVKKQKMILKNARKYYVVTVGRLHWRATDLAQNYKAKCQARQGEAQEHTCRGLALPLGNDKSLLVGEQYLPLRSLNAFNNHTRVWTTLARIKTTNGAFTGDLALPYNFQRTNWTYQGRSNHESETNGSACRASREEFVSNMLDNHFYSEEPLQPAYTAAVMWLMQHGVVRDHVNASSSEQHETTLTFAGNRYHRAYVASTPHQSLVYTCMGCGLLLVCVVSVLAWQQYHGPIEAPVPPAAIAKLLVDERVCPAPFVSCALGDGSNDMALSSTEIRGMTLRDGNVDNEMVHFGELARAKWV